MGLTEKQEDEVVNAYKKYNGKVASAFKNLPFVDRRDIIIKIWRQYELISPKKQKGRRVGDGKYSSALTDEDIERIVESYKIYANASQASKHLHHSRQTISRVWEEHELPPKNKRRLESRVI